MLKAKLVLFFLIISFSGNVYSNTQDKISLEQIEAIRADLRPKSKVMRALRAINSGIDYALTKKGALKIVVCSSPFIAAYCLFYSANPIEKIAGMVIKQGKKIEEMYKIQGKIGAAEANIESIKSDFWGNTKVFINNSVSKIINAGLPFIATGLCIKILGFKN